MKQRLIGILVLLCISGASWAQGTPGADSLASADSIANPVYNRRNEEPIDWRPRALRVGIDLGGPGRLAFSNNVTHVEGVADVQFHKYHLVLEGGGTRANYGLEGNFNYGMEGGFVRLGVDANLLSLDYGSSGIYLGARYGLAAFSDVLFIFPFEDSTGWDDASVIGILNENTAMRAQWWEAAFGLRTVVWQGLTLGYTARFKFGYSTLVEIENRPYATPGYGRVEALPWNMTAYVLWSIPFKLKEKEETSALE
ncbi:MAG TPA: hypothetical protein DCE41_15915 [Cytophagales bacterium]|nr:hypothetical protein [Cytophagales bacterium]HAA22826.1 hypothetical protein [Cytophagales bacterium]